MSVTATPLSLNEIGFYFTRAAVGAGAPFGIAEDFAESSKWVAYLSFDPAKAAVPALHGLAGGESGMALTLRQTEDLCRIESGDGRILSAIYAGPAVADRLSIAAAGAEERGLSLNKTDQPLLIAASAAAACAPATHLAMSWRSRSGEPIVVELDRGLVTVTGPDEADIAACGPASVEIVVNGDGGMAPLTSQTATRRLAEGRSAAVECGVAVDGMARSAVFDFFSRCLVPSTGQSRTAGAGGGGLTDND